MKVKMLAIDCEFSCFDMVGGDLLSVGLVEVMEDYSLGREGEFYFRPSSPKYFSDEAVKIHGISYWRAQTFPAPKDSCVSMLHWLKPLLDDFPLSTAFYGSWPFDKKWIEMTFGKVELTNSYLKAFHGTDDVNVFKMAKEKLKQIKNHDLKSVAKHYGIEFEHHNALSDAKATALILGKLVADEDTWTGKLL